MNFNGLKSSEVEVSRTTYGSNKLPEPELKKWYHFAKEALTEPITMISNNNCFVSVGFRSYGSNVSF